MSILSILIILLTLNANIANSKSNSTFSISGGLALPNSEVNNLFNSNTINTADTSNPLLGLVRPSSSAGYSLSAKLTYELSQSAHFFGGFTLTGLGSSKLNLKDLETLEEDGFLDVKSSIYSLNAGIHYYLLDGALSIYGIGNLSYNFIASSFKEIESSTTLRLPNNPTDNRLGFTAGLGFEIPLELLSIIIETKYSDINYIGKGSTEETKSLIVLEAGFRF